MYHLRLYACDLMRNTNIKMNLNVKIIHQSHISYLSGSVNISTAVQQQHHNLRKVSSTRGMEWCHTVRLYSTCVKEREKD